MYAYEIYGASDDLIEIEGDLTEEFPYDGEEKGEHVGLSDGTLLSVAYNGCWRIAILARGVGTIAEWVPAVGEDDDNYSDRVKLTTERQIKWAIKGHDIVRQ